MDVHKNLSRNLKSVRQRRSLTQAQLAKLCSVPRSTIANLEADGGNPTLSVLTRIVSALELSIEELLSQPKGFCEVFSKNSLPLSSKDRGRASMRRLLPYATPGIEIDRIELQAGARFSGAPHRAGTSEYLFCERGSMVLWVSGERYQLHQGDVAVFPGEQAHSYHNEGRGLSIGFSVVSLSIQRS